MQHAPSSRRDHWLTFHFDEEFERQIIDGCRCGFKADLDADMGWGDSVVDHLILVSIVTATTAMQQDVIDHGPADILDIQRVENRLVKEIRMDELDESTPLSLVPTPVSERSES